MTATALPTKRRVAHPIAVRQFHVVDHPEQVVTITIGKPRPDPKSKYGDWRCTVLVEGTPNARRTYVHGVDALQALQLAFEYTRSELDKSGLVLTWDGGDEPGDVGIARLIPLGWGRDFARKLEGYVDREVRRFGNAVSQAHRKAEAVQKKEPPSE